MMKETVTSEKPTHQKHKHQMPNNKNSMNTIHPTYILPKEGSNSQGSVFSSVTHLRTLKMQHTLADITVVLLQSTQNRLIIRGN